MYSPPKQVAPKKKAVPKGVKKPVQSEEGETMAEENQSFLRRYVRLGCIGLLVGKGY
jgi:hypothetical protein